MYMNGIPPEKKTRPAESPEAALIRKIKEDLNIDVTVGSRINTTEYDYPAIHLSMDCDWGSLQTEQFSNGSYGYRPHRSAKDAILKVKEYADEGYYTILQTYKKRADLSDRFLCRADRLYEFSAILFPL